MEPTPTRCKWATQTMFLRWPYWLDAWSLPWTCVRQDAPKMLADTESCSVCPFREISPSTGDQEIKK